MKKRKYLKVVEALGDGGIYMTKKYFYAKFAKGSPTYRLDMSSDSFWDIVWSAYNIAAQCGEEVKYE